MSEKIAVAKVENEIRLYLGHGNISVQMESYVKGKTGTQLI